MCGEKDTLTRWTESTPGSPPRVRGEDVLFRGKLPAGGITPACAGRRRCIISPIGILEDHPRVCGEKVQMSSEMKISQGSPPRVRGEGIEPHFLYRLHGITPACAGRSDRGDRRADRCQDHPRVCGEKPYPSGFSPQSKGSPPRVRGEARRRCGTAAQLGITPACAGRSLSDQYWIRAKQDHPRVCGEKRSAMK